MSKVRFYLSHASQYVARGEQVLFVIWLTAAQYLTLHLSFYDITAGRQARLYSVITLS